MTNGIGQFNNLDISGDLFRTLDAVPENHRIYLGIDRIFPELCHVVLDADTGLGRDRSRVYYPEELTGRDFRIVFGLTNQHHFLLCHELAHIYLFVSSFPTAFFYRSLERDLVQICEKIANKLTDYCHHLWIRRYIEDEYGLVFQPGWVDGLSRCNQEIVTDRFDSLEQAIRTFKAVREYPVLYQEYSRIYIEPQANIPVRDIFNLLQDRIGDRSVLIAESLDQRVMFELIARVFNVVKTAAEEVCFSSGFRLDEISLRPFYINESDFGAQARDRLEVVDKGGYSKVIYKIRGEEDMRVSLPGIRCGAPGLTDALDGKTVGEYISYLVSSSLLSPNYVRLSDIDGTSTDGYD